MTAETESRKVARLEESAVAAPDIAAPVDEGIALLRSSCDVEGARPLRSASGDSLAGSGGAVYEGTRRGVAAIAKLVHPVADAEAEVAHMRLAAGPGVVELLAAVPALGVIVTRRADGGDVVSYVNDHGAMYEAVARRVALCVIRALRRLHRAGAVHNDLKPENILLSRPMGASRLSGLWDACLADFGKAARFLRQGTDRYMAPEARAAVAAAAAAARGHVDARLCDMYSVGAALYVALTGVALDGAAFDAASFDAARSASGRGRVSRNCVRALGALLAHDPADRPTAAAALRLPWLA